MFDAFSEFGGEAFAVGVDDRLIAEIENGGHTAERQEPEHVGEERRVVPPADAVARGRFAVGRAIAYGEVGYGHVRFRGEREERRIEGKYPVALRTRPLGENDNALALRKPFNYFFTGPRDVAFAFAVDVNGAHVAHHSAHEGPTFDLVFRDENALDGGSDHRDIKITQVIGNEEKWRFRGRSNDLDIAIGDAHERPGPLAKDDLAPVNFIRDEPSEGQPDNVKAERRRE